MKLWAERRHAVPDLPETVRFTIHASGDYEPQVEDENHIAEAMERAEKAMQDYFIREAQVPLTVSIEY